ncbi:YOR020W-A [Zygosaccharomyces parabailii]|nr:YOR020W-A [Zygosaccharomyces parabailii]SJM88557.1 uncharacterized protein ZBIST_4746 [Zygosaccharomyces bailii]
MGNAYTIFGKQVQPHFLAILTLGTAAGLGVWASAGKKEEAKTPAASKDNEEINVEKMIDDFISKESIDK